LGAGFVVGTASSDERRAFVRRLGADLAIPYDTSEWPQEVLRNTDGQGVDIILESIGGKLSSSRTLNASPISDGTSFSARREASANHSRRAA
jgi:NADPH:quinone reductase-like Zn-dependent oxidoreductase